MRVEALWRRRLGAWLLCAGIWAAPFPGLGRDLIESVTQVPTRPVSSEYFGTHIHRLQGTPVGEPGVTRWPSVQVGQLRLWDSGVAWLDLNPSPGRWDFRRLDFYVEAAEAHQATVLYTLGLTPAWASARPAERCPYGMGCAAEPRDMAVWADYVRSLALRYGNRIAAYELWNEPNFSDLPRDRGQPGFYTGSVAQLVEMARVARLTLDQVNPTAQLCTPGFVNGVDRLEKFLAAGGRHYVQAVCYHFYASHVGRMADEVRQVRAAMARHGVAHLPLWNTETGVELHQPGEPPSGLAGQNVEEIAARLAQLMLFGAAAGIDRFYQYAWDNHRSGMFQADGQPRLALSAVDTLAQWLDGATVGPCRSLSRLGEPVVACQGRRDRNRHVWLWVDSAATPVLPVSALLAALGLPPGQVVRAVEPLFGNRDTMNAAWQRGELLLGRVPVRLTLPLIR